MALVKINGRERFFDCGKVEIKEISSGRYAVSVWAQYGSEDGPDYGFTVVGGRKSGGAANEWFCHYPEVYGEQWVSVNSMVAAVNAGVNV